MIAIFNVLNIEPDKSFGRAERRTDYDEFLELDDVAFGLRTELLTRIVLPARYDVFGQARSYLCLAIRYPHLSKLCLR
jgi:hypothetical protein